MIPHDQEGRYTGGRETDQPMSELPLVGLAGITALVCVAAAQNEVRVRIDRVVDGLIEALKEVGQPSRQPGIRIRLPEVLDSYVHVREVNYAHHTGP